jgi:hypothetical protein
MLFARYGKQANCERNSGDALANERSHSAVAQLSVSGGVCKAKARVGATACRVESLDHDYDRDHDQEQKQEAEEEL